MERVLDPDSLCGARTLRLGRPRICSVALSVVLSVGCFGCKRLQPVDTSPLMNSGMGYDAMRQLSALKVTAAEVGEIAKARQGGFSDDDCVKILKIYKNRNQSFDAGDAVAGLAQVGMSDADILGLATMNELGLGWGELQAMKLAGMSEAIVMAEAQQRASGKPALSGAALARLKNAGVRETTLLKLVEKAVPDSKASAILSYRRRGASDADILRLFAGS